MKTNKELAELRDMFYKIMLCIFKEKVETKFGKQFFIYSDFVENSSQTKNVYIYERVGDEVKMKYSYILFNCRSCAEMNAIFRTFNFNIEEILDTYTCDGVPF